MSKKLNLIGKLTLKIPEVAVIWYTFYYKTLNFYAHSFSSVIYLLTEIEIETEIEIMFSKMEMKYKRKSERTKLNSN